MSYILGNRYIKAYIGKKGSQYYIQCAGMDTIRTIPASYVRLFIIDPQIRTNRELKDYIDLKTYTINGLLASEWVSCYLPENRLKGNAELTANNTVLFYAPKAKKEFTYKEFGCWFGSSVLPASCRVICNNRLTYPISLIDKSEENMRKLQLNNIERAKRFITPLLQMCLDKWVNVQYLRSYLSPCGREGEPYKMMMVAEMQVTNAVGVTRRTDLGLVYFGDERRHIYMYINGTRVELEGLRDTYEMLVA